MQELFMMANLIYLDSKNFSTAMLYCRRVFFPPVLPYEVIRTVCLYAAQEETAKSGTGKRTQMS